MNKNMYGLYDIRNLLEGQIAYLYRAPDIKYLGLYKQITNLQVKWFFTSEPFISLPDKDFIAFPKFIGWSTYDSTNSLVYQNEETYLKDVFID